MSLFEALPHQGIIDFANDQAEKNNFTKPDKSAAEEATRLVSEKTTPERLRPLVVRMVTGGKCLRNMEGAAADICAIADALGKFDWGKVTVCRHTILRELVGVAPR